MANNHVVKTEKFEGPLDLLLSLIEKEKLDICELSLAKITDNFLHAMTNINSTEGEIVEFLVIASKLLYIKSRTLLPNIENDTVEQVDDLEQQLIEYKKYKEAAAHFQQILKKNLRSFSANPTIELPNLFREPANVSLDLLSSIFVKAIASAPEEETVKEKKVDYKITMEEKLESLKDLLQKKKQISFRSFIKKSLHKAEIVISFLAVLEMLKRKYIVLEQTSNFSDIKIRVHA